MPPRRKRPDRYRLFFSLLCVAGLMPLNAHALIQVGYGNTPVRDGGWPEGSLAVANLSSRVGWWEGPPFGGGEWQFLYRGDTAAFNQALTAFVLIRAPSIELVVHDGPEENSFLKMAPPPNTDTRVDWTFTVWHPESWYRLFNNPRSFFEADHPNFRQPVNPPRLDLYIGGGGLVDWDKITVPKNVRFRDVRASSAGVHPVGGAVIRADVYDMASGKPVSGAHLIIARWSSTEQSPKTTYEMVAEADGDETGRVQVERIPPGAYRITVSADGYASRVLGNERCTDGSFKLFEVELAKAAEIHGTVNGPDGQPIKDITVRASNLMAINGRGYRAPEAVETVTDEAGHFDLKGLPTGFTQLWAGAPDYYFGDIFTLYDVPTTNIVLRLTGAGTIQVAITDQSGKAIARWNGNEILVNIEPKGGSKLGSWGGSAKVSDTGTVEFTRVPPGEYRITSQPNPAVTGKQYAPEQIITLKPGGRASVKMVYE